MKLHERGPDLGLRKSSLDICTSTMCQDRSETVMGREGGKHQLGALRTSGKADQEDEHDIKELKNKSLRKAVHVLWPV